MDPFPPILWPGSFMGKAQKRAERGNHGALPERGERRGREEGKVRDGGGGIGRQPKGQVHGPDWGQVSPFPRGGASRRLSCTEWLSPRGGDVSAW